MLVLTRRAGESIVIGDDVRVVVLDVRGDTVRLGIEAPRSIQVHRAEVYAEVQAANAAAASSGESLEEVAERLRRLARPVVPQRRNGGSGRSSTPKPGPPPGSPSNQPPTPGSAAPAGPPASGAASRPVPTPPARGTSQHEQRGVRTMRASRPVPAPPRSGVPKPGPIGPIPRPGTPAEETDAEGV
ncbi:carbon storage regulator CsrA [Kineosporia babensis]|uniref:carbon storage regulator CsrA n=1 Tax=Kineosporia babensis TaxID=499548 RepID=UPI002F35BD90